MKKPIIIISLLTILSLILYLNIDKKLRQEEEIVTGQAECSSYEANLQKNLDKEARVLSKTGVAYIKKINETFYNPKEKACFAVIKVTKINTGGKYEYYKIVNLVTNKVTKIPLGNKAEETQKFLEQKIQEIKTQ